MCRGGSFPTSVMDQILQQLGGLLWGALPTTIIVFLFILFMKWAFWTPFQRVLEQRDAVTAGARKGAEEMMTRAEEKVRQYEDSLREVRAEIYLEQETARKQALDDRAAAITAARKDATMVIEKARAEIAAEVKTARRTLEAEAEKLADEIAGSLLNPGSGKRGNA